MTSAENVDLTERGLLATDHKLAWLYPSKESFTFRWLLSLLLGGSN